jgi:hypothetical protein
MDCNIFRDKNYESLSSVFPSDCSTWTDSACLADQLVRVKSHLADYADYQNKEDYFKCIYTDDIYRNLSSASEVWQKNPSQYGATAILELLKIFQQVAPRKHYANIFSNVPSWVDSSEHPFDPAQFLNSIKQGLGSYRYRFVGQHKFNARETIDFIWYYVEIFREWRRVNNNENYDEQLKTFLCDSGCSIEADKYNHGIISSHLHTIGSFMKLDLIDIKAPGIPENERLNIANFFGAFKAKHPTTQIRISGTADQVKDLVTIADELVLHEYKGTYERFKKSFSFSNIKSTTIKFSISEEKVILTYPETRESLHLEIRSFTVEPNLQLIPDTHVIERVDSIETCTFNVPTTPEMKIFIENKCKSVNDDSSYQPFGKVLTTPVLDQSHNNILEDLTLTGLPDITQLIQVPPTLKSLTFMTSENYILPVAPPALANQLKSMTILQGTNALTWRYMFGVSDTVNLQDNLTSYTQLESITIKYHHTNRHVILPEIISGNLSFIEFDGVILNKPVLIDVLVMYIKIQSFQDFSKSKKNLKVSKKVKKFSIEIVKVSNPEQESQSLNEFLKSISGPEIIDVFNTSVNVRIPGYNAVEISSRSVRYNRHVIN